MAGLNAFKLTLAETLNWSGSITQTGLPSGPSGSGTLTPPFSLSSGIANAAAGGANTFYYNLASVVNGTPFSFSLANYTDIVNQTGQSMARVKFWFFWLLSASQTDPSGLVTGTACSGITVGAGSNPFGFGLSTATVTQAVNNGGVLQNLDGSASGVAVNTNVTVQVANGDSGNVAKVIIAFAGGTT